MAAYFPNLFRENNLSLYAVPAAWAVSIAPHFYAVWHASTTFDNRAPRNLVSKVQGDVTIAADVKARIARAEAAQSNGFENLGLFAATVAAGNAAGLSPLVLNSFSAVYLASRTLFNFLYIYGENDTYATARSVTYLSGIALVSSVFIAAGNKLRKPLFALA